MFYLPDSPADLHGMWYPTVRRTLVCLSRLYRCVDRPIFQGLSQEALKLCIQSVSSAATKISQTKVSFLKEIQIEILSDLNIIYFLDPH